MITKKYKQTYQPKNALEELLFTKDSIFFDIETTGFSAVKNELYLIGCGFRQKDSLCIVQFFAEKKEEQGEILTAFLSLLSNFHTILSFNGLGFDLPFLITKCHLLHIEENFDAFAYIDIFKSVSRFKNLLQLPNYKQKTLEQFLEIDRDDTKSGGELIALYQSYEKGNHEDALLSTLLLHNHDDVLNMLPLIQLMAYEKFFSGNYNIINIKEHDYTDFSGIPAKELLCSGEIKFALPKRISAKSDLAFLLAEEDHFTLSIPFYSGVLKYFYPDYKNYYYLPKEDIAVHKSVAGFVDKNFRTPAKASTCYTKKEGLFLPQPKDLFSPSFKKEYKDKTTFFLYEEKILTTDTKERQSYIHQLLQLFP